MHRKVVLQDASILGYVRLKQCLTVYTVNTIVRGDEVIIYIYVPQGTVGHLQPVTLSSTFFKAL